MSGHWSAIEARGVVWADFCKAVAALPDDQFWRHNQVGDLDGENNALNVASLEALVEANRGKRGFTYTHKPLTVEDLRRAYALKLESAGMPLEQAWIKARALEITPADVTALRSNRAAIAAANLNGFTVNVSRDSLDAVDALGVGPLPIVVVLPMLEKGEREPKVTYTPAGHKVVTCPAQWRPVEMVAGKEKHFSCNDCKLCAVSDRTYVIGFRAHGIAKRVVSNMVVPANSLVKSKRRAA